ncbi:glycosyltransferase [Halioglobus japonicus]|uniref:glycosyltransferase n=1 Tax=Halioglobus japonicus TaxID=930805 RepID=UPI001F0B271D|nr:glycosyltransferase family 4 protein [Halioglobus japonicus]
MGALVTVTGNLDHAALLESVHSANIVVVPSLSEGFGLTALEAMALSKPVVASDVGGLKEVIIDGESGVLFPAGDSEELASILLELVNSPELMQRIGLAARERAEAAFSLGMIADQYIDVYQEQLQHAQ